MMAGAMSGSTISAFLRQDFNLSTCASRITRRKARRNILYQKIIVVGNLGSDPEMRYMPDGTAVTNFSLATNRRWTDKSGEPREETIWLRVSVWDKQAETVNQYLSKGSKVLVEGRLQPDPATGSPRLFTRHDGTVGTSYEIRADTVRFLSTVAESQANAQNAANGEISGNAGNPAPEEDMEDDDLPF